MPAMPARATIYANHEGQLVRGTRHIRAGSRQAQGTPLVPFLDRDRGGTRAMKSPRHTFITANWRGTTIPTIARAVIVSSEVYAWIHGNCRTEWDFQLTAA